MENATKAILIAAGIFFTIAIMTFGVYTYVSLHNVAESQDEKTEQEQLVAFNKRYLAFNRNLMYGTDIVTVMNMAKEDNAKYGLNINITCKMYTPYYYKYNGKERVRQPGILVYAAVSPGITTQNGRLDEILSDEGKFDDFKRRLFRCTEVTYATDGSGRISSMEFKEVPLDDYLHK